MPSVLCNGVTAAPASSSWISTSFPELMSGPSPYLFCSAPALSAGFQQRINPA
jgi:hypothetical protein